MDQDKRSLSKTVPLGVFTGCIGEDIVNEAKRTLNDSFMPFKVTRHYTNLIASQEEPFRSQLRNIVIPPSLDKNFEGRFDPYGNIGSRVSESYLQHKYPNTLLVHLTDGCFANCQFCYKVGEIREGHTANASPEKIAEEAMYYLDEHSEIDNVLLTGGDPFTMSSKRLIEVMQVLLRPEFVKTLRIATKGLSFDPERFRDLELLDYLRDINLESEKRIKVVAQYNHPAEMCAESITSLRLLQQVGVQVYGQPVILKGVNDDVEVLTELQNKFLANNVQSYYLVSFMPVRGVEQYALPLEKTFRLVRESKKRLNGLAKKAMLIAPHDWGKLEICGFLPTASEPERVMLKWHEIAMPHHLPRGLRGYTSEDLLELRFKANEIYCLDDILRYNGLPFVQN